jgi:C-1 hydroxylase
MKGDLNMSTEENKAQFRRQIEYWNNKDMDPFWENIPSDIVVHEESGKIFNKDEYKKQLEWILTAFPDYTLAIEDLIAVNDKVIVRYTESATMKGDFMGVTATGKSVSIPAIEIWRFDNGRVKEIWMGRDILTFLTQAGVIPAKE